MCIVQVSESGVHRPHWTSTRCVCIVQVSESGVRRPHWTGTRCVCIVQVSESGVRRPHWTSTRCVCIVQVSESGVHRPHVAGIHGRDNDGAYSIVLSGGYEDDQVYIASSFCLLVHEL